MTRYRFGWMVLFTALAPVVGAGCGGSGEEVVRARGRLTNAGKPLHVENREIGVGVVRIEFYRIGEDGKQSPDPEESTVVNADGSFDFPGRDGSGIRPGKYRIAVWQWDPYPDTDKLGGKFDAQNSPIVREVTGKEDILIDLSKPEG